MQGGGALPGLSRRRCARDTGHSENPVGVTRDLCYPLRLILDPRLQTALVAIEHHYGARLMAVALFGSRVGKRARDESDWDLLLVVDEREPIRRTLYREWDAAVAPSVERSLTGIAPHFVHLPDERDEPSGFWLEIAMSHVVLRDPTGRLASCLGRVRTLVETGRFERRAVHGCGYWRRAG